MKNHALVGTWKLESYELRPENDRPYYPLGEDATGHLTYTHDGFMSVALMKSNRGEFASKDFMGGTVEERLSAIDSFISYCGRYEIEKDKVTHHIELSWFPNWIGTKQERFFDLGLNTLTLRTDPFLVDGKQQTAFLVWRRS